MKAPAYLTSHFLCGFIERGNDLPKLHTNDLLIWLKDAIFKIFLFSKLPFACFHFLFYFFYTIFEGKGLYPIFEGKRQRTPWGNVVIDIKNPFKKNASFWA